MDSIVSCVSAFAAELPYSGRGFCAKQAKVLRSPIAINESSCLFIFDLLAVCLLYSRLKCDCGCKNRRG